MKKREDEDFDEENKATCKSLLGYAWKAFRFGCKMDSVYNFDGCVLHALTCHAVTLISLTSLLK